jgi:TPR repeat protein
VARVRLGVALLEGQGVARDEAEALSWFKKAAGQKNTDAMFFIGTMYTKGWGVPRDDKAALAWFTRAAELGASECQLERGKQNACTGVR